MRRLLVLIALCAAALPARAQSTAPAPAPQAAEPESIPGGHLYFGLSTSMVMLPRGSTWLDDNSVAPSGAPESGFTVGLVLSVEVERALAIGTLEAGGAGGGTLGRAGLLLGYILTEGLNAPYLAAGVSVFGKSFGVGDNPVSGTSGNGLALEAGYLIGRSHRFGRITAEATVVLPMAGLEGVWTPWVSLGLRFQL